MKKRGEQKLLMSSLFAGVTILAFSRSVEAAPLQNEKITLKQPNGEVIHCYASGDEFYNYFHDGKNQLVIKNPRTGYYSYVKYDNNKVKPSQNKVQKDEAAGEIKDNYINIPKEEIDKKRSELEALGQGNIQNINGNKRTVNNINIFVKFSDQADYEKDADYFENLFNSANGSSLRNFYKEASYNKVDVITHSYPKADGKKVLTYNDPHPRSYYSNYPSSDRGKRENDLVQNAIESIKNQIPKDMDLDSDNDGLVDNICLIVRGEAEGWNSLLWPHQTGISKSVEINGKKVSKYNFQIEASINDDKRGVGVLAHEMFHTFGAPDLYKYYGDSGVPVDKWDLMGKILNPPQHMGAYMKMKYGKWIDIPEINKTGTYSINDITTENNNSYIIKSGKSDSEYFVVEYRGVKGFDKSLSQEGLIVTRINTKAKGDEGLANEVYVLRADTNKNYVTNANINPNGLIKNIGTGSKILMDFSNGVDSGIKIENVKLNNGRATFDVIYPGDGKVVEKNKEKIVKKNNEKTAKEIADSIISVEQPKDNENKIKLPVVPEGYSIKLSYSSMQSGIDLNGNIIRQKYDNNISVKFEVVRLSDQTKAETNVFNILVKAKVDKTTEGLQPRVDYLSNMQIERSRSIAGGVWINKTPYNNKIQLGGVKYDNGISFYSTADAQYNLKGSYSRFTADLGINDEVGQYGSVEAQIYGDGNLLYSSGLITGKDYVKKIDIDIRNVNNLQLVITNGGDGQAYDSVSFANPKLYSK